jgi:hypothetical protein
VAPRTETELAMTTGSDRVVLVTSATRFDLVSAMGANPKPRVFYNRIKGEMKRALANMGFKSLLIARSYPRELPRHPGQGSGPSLDPGGAGGQTRRRDTDVRRHARSSVVLALADQP